MSSEKIEKFRQMVERNPDNELAQYSLGSVLLESGSFEEAESCFARALAAKNDWVLAYILRARCLIRMGRPEEARGLLETGRRHAVEQQHQDPIEEIDELLEDLP